MSLTKAIKFQYLFSQLTHEECVGFLSKLVDSHMDIIVGSLFCHFVKANQNQINELNSFNESLSNIIQSRKEKPKAISPRNMTLSRLPRAIIGHTASFLEPYDYIDFSMSNRSIYLGCNSPNLLHALNVTDITDCLCIDLSSFPSIKTLSIDPSEFNTYSCNSPHLTQITTLSLLANKKVGWIEHFLNQKIIDYDTVRVLWCSQFGDLDNDLDMESNEFLKLLASFPNLNHIKMSNVFLTRDITAQDIATVCPNIIGLGVNGGCGQLNNDLITLFARKLKYLSCTEIDETDEMDFDTVSFDTLEELQMMTPSYRSFHSIIKSASNLRKIFVRTESKGASDGFMGNGDIKRAMNKLIVKCPRLKYICLAVKCKHFCSVLEGIECGLFETKNQRRSRAEMRIYVNVYGADVKIDHFALNVGRIINSLDSSTTTDFMFIWKLRDLCSKKFEKMLKHMCNISKHTRIWGSRNAQKFIITNRNCKINGYQDSICGDRQLS
eukprot:675978_1